MKYQYKFTSVFTLLLGLFCFLFIGITYDYDAKIILPIPIIKKHPSFRIKYASKVEQSNLRTEDLLPSEQKEELNYRAMMAGENGYYSHYLFLQPVFAQLAVLLIVISLIKLLWLPRNLSAKYYVATFFLGLILQVAGFIICWSYLYSLLNEPIFFYCFLIIINFLLLILLTKQAEKISY